MTRVLRPVGRDAVRRRNRIAALLIAGGFMALTACGGKSSGDSPKSPSTAGSPPPSSASASKDPQAQAKSDVLKAYSAFWAEQVKAYAQTDIKGTNLKQYATKKALGRTMGDLLVMKQAGTATSGAPTHQVDVISIALTGSVPKATLQDCLDISNWKTIKKESGKVQPFPSNQPLRYVTVAKAEKWGDQWMFTELAPDGKHTC